MGQIISITRNPCVIGKVTDDEGNILEIEAPLTFLVGTAPDADSPEVKAIRYNSHGNAWLRRSHYEVLFDGSDVKRLIPEEDVVDIAVDMADKKKKKKNAADDVPDLSAETPEE